jgi:hypothetical protein
MSLEIGWWLQHKQKMLTCPDFVFLLFFNSLGGLRLYVLADCGEGLNG